MEEKSHQNKKEYKKNFGQFYTTNYEYILQNMSIPKDVKHIIEPFAGKGDMLKFINIEEYEVECYDIEPKSENIIQRDTFTDPPLYKNKFIITNPPYLARNKSKDKSIFDKYKTNDLYKCFFEEIITNNSIGGIVIVPLNFLCSIRKSDINLRRRFLSIYYIKLINIFEENVFDDTSYTVCSFQFEIKNKDNNTLDTIDTYIYPSIKKIQLSFTSENNYIFGGEIYNLPISSKYKICRATKNTKENITNILLKCIDNNIDDKLGFVMVDDKNIFIDNTSNLTERSFATLVINKSMSYNEQSNLVKKMNTFIEKQREKYNSLFLANYRESNTISRKRISFNLAFRICNYILSTE